MFEHEPAGRVFKHLPRDPANVSARNKMVDRYSCINLLYLFALSDPLIRSPLFLASHVYRKTLSVQNFMRIISQITIASEKKENVMMMAKSVEILRKDNDCFQFERKVDFKVNFKSTTMCKVQLQSMRHRAQI